MRLIAKGREPAELVTYRQQGGARYDGDASFVAVKQALREALVRDQGALCCYCEARVRDTADEMNIEHWEPQSWAPSRQLDWKNLLAACKGNPGSGADSRHCDHQKGDEPITLDPQRERHVRTISFTANGGIRSNDPALQDDIDRRLHLNLPRLRANRTAAVQALVSGFRRRYGGEFPRDALRHELEQHTRPGANGPLPPYASAVAFWLRRRLGERP